MSEEDTLLVDHWRREFNEARAAARLFYAWLFEEWRDRAGPLAELEEVASLYDWLGEKTVAIIDQKDETEAAARRIYAAYEDQQLEAAHRELMERAAHHSVQADRLEEQARHAAKAFRDREALSQAAFDEVRIIRDEMFKRLVKKAADER